MKSLQGYYSETIMKTVKVSIQDENTLVLQEDADKGDLIDLKSLHELDIDKTSITSVVNSIKRNVFNEEVRKKVREETESIRRENELQLELKVKDISHEKDQKITNLENEIEKSNQAQELAIIKAVDPIKKELDHIKVEKESREKSYEEEIERLKDMKIKLSTKMIGESLEQYCQNEFNKIRATAFPNAYFEKDNDSNRGSKGDYIFRDPANGVESVSIMFEMKNENDETTTKKHNEEFLKELDKDRNEKNCEYAILVSMLEAESDLYNQGIVDVSYKYPKMYVIRPQFFIPMITLLKNAAEKSLTVKKELAIIKSQNIDITTFEDDVNNWKTGFLTTMKNAGQKHSEAIEQINKAIKNLENVRDALTMSDKHLLAAENKMEDLTIKRLTRKNPTMATKFDELKKK